MRPSKKRFHDRFVPVEEFSSYLANFLCLLAAEAAICEGRITDREVRDTLKQADLKKIAGAWWFTIWKLLEAVARVCANSDW